MKIDPFKEGDIASEFFVDCVTRRPSRVIGNTVFHQAAFPVVKAILDGVGSKESKHAIKLTSQG